MADADKSSALLQQWFKLGVEQLHAARWQEAESIYRRMLTRWPQIPELHHNLGMALKGQGKSQEGIAAFEAALALRPGFLEAYNNLGNTLRDMHLPAQAIEAYRRAVALRGDSEISWNNLGVVLKDTGQFDEAQVCFRRSMSAPNGYAVAHDNLLCTIHFDPRYDAPAIFAEARRWNEQFARPLQKYILPHDNDPSPGRRLRIGYVSGDFRRHCQALFTPPLLANHDHKQFEVFCYSAMLVPDLVTARIKRYADVWRDISGLNDEQAAQLIRQDKIDILIDLTLHMTGNRLLVFARKPAPIQVTWLGYPGTTGLDAIDYRLTDPRLDPPASENVPIESGTASGAILIAQSAVSSSEQGPSPRQDTADSLRSLAVPLTLGIKEPFYSERSIHLPDSFWCYDPRGMEDNPDMPMPEPGPLPALAAGYVTFGCLNNFCKINDGLLELWAQVLAAVPHSRLLMLAPPGSHRERVVQKLGVTPETPETPEAPEAPEAPARVQFVPLQPRRQYLETYNRIDLCLDTLPANGHTTSLDALWMGVPVITRMGHTSLGRGGASQLHNLGLTELVAHSDRQFIQLAVELAGDLGRLRGLRLSLRQRMERSPLMDGPRFAQHVEGAFRQMWRTWCVTRA